MPKTTSDNLIDLAKRVHDLRAKRMQRATVAKPEAERAVALGLRHLSGQEGKRDPSKAARYLATAANGGLVQAKHELALLHLKGDGVAYDPGYAIELLQSASADGYVPSSISLAELYIFGQHCDRDADKALELLHPVVSEHEPAVMYYLAYIYDKNPEHHNAFEAAYWYRRAAEYGHFKSQIRLASLYATGKGVPRCLATAEAFLDVALDATAQQDPRLLLWQSERLVAQPETEFVAQALVRAAAAMNYAPAQRLLLQRGWRH
jgi:TPR repeat protein